MCRVDLSQSQFGQGSAELEMVRSAPLTGAQGELMQTKGRSQVRK